MVGCPWSFGSISPSHSLQGSSLQGSSLLGQPCSSSCCERNWSTYNFIHSVRRNKITPQRAEDLVFVHTNLRLLARRSPSYNESATQMWDVGGDEFDSLEESNVGRLEIANLSLDEPQLEGVLFNVDDEDEDLEDVVQVE
ncbi:putative HAT dimerization domain, ribonuclease H-like domain-containing protein [Rosa chinensis]|uniref:Putative HAT dimerization domain, ribonuclease H-like domain-containing protein n=1 Tax=Rosa chinensis TaxID=74649 RepID=A0A2P6QY19_ROSCH|nr:putative HAT dimerization domain, ribonuclease H-like domain-containing protein [Rosa chinensis]